MDFSVKKHTTEKRMNKWFATSNFLADVFLKIFANFFYADKKRRNVFLFNQEENMIPFFYYLQENIFQGETLLRKSKDEWNAYTQLIVPFDHKSTF